MLSHSKDLRKQSRGALPTDRRRSLHFPATTNSELSELMQEMKTRQALNISTTFASATKISVNSQVISWFLVLQGKFLQGTHPGFLVITMDESVVLSITQQQQLVIFFFWAGS